MRLYSVEHPGLWVGWLDGERARALLRGLPHALVMLNEEGDAFVLLSALAKPCRLSDTTDPLSAQVLLLPSPSLFPPPPHAPSLLSSHARSLPLPLPLSTPCTPLPHPLHEVSRPSPSSLTSSFPPPSCLPPSLPSFLLSHPSSRLRSQLLISRNSPGWADSLGSVKHYLYTVHRSQLYLTPPSLAATLTLFVLKWLARDFESTMALCGACGSDTPLAPEEAQLWQLM